MNRGRIHRQYRTHRRGSGRPVDLCLRCFKFGHRRRDCFKDPIVACGNCFRAYFFTTGCVCNQSNTEGMTLRMVGGEPFPRPCIDLVVANRPFEALINQSTSRAKINLHVLDHINNVRIEMNLATIPIIGIFEHQIQRRNKLVTVEFEVQQDQTVPIIAGMEILMKTGFEFSMDNVKINDRSPVLDTANTVDFLYNLDGCEALRNWMRRSNKLMYNQYRKDEEALLQEEPRVIINNDNRQLREADSDADILEIHANELDLETL